MCVYLANEFYQVVLKTVCLPITNIDKMPLNSE